MNLLSTILLLSSLLKWSYVIIQVTSISLTISTTIITTHSQAATIPHSENKSWIRFIRHKRDSSCPDCLSSEERISGSNNNSSSNSSKSRCIIEREEGLLRRAQLNGSSSEFIPVCRRDGSYVTIQCHRSTRSCWCVTETGRPIPGSSVIAYGTSNRPNCSKYNEQYKSATKRRSSQGKKNRKSCNHGDRSRFNAALLKTFRSEFNRYRSFMAMSLEGDSDEDDTVLAWKFDHLDKNKDVILQRNETQILKNLVKQQIQPRQCAKNFISFCAKGDKRITKREWIECLRIGSIDNRFFRGMTHPSQLLRPVGSFVRAGESGEMIMPPISARGSIPDVVEISNCWTDRHSVLQTQKLGSNESIIVPECTLNGNYKKIQCAQGKAYCWCVDEESGTQIPNTIVINSTPDCDKKARLMKGCAGQKKEKFLKDLIDYIAKMMGQEHRRQQGVIENKSFVEQAAKWYFQMLDSNANGILDRREWKEFRNETSKEKILKRCGKKLPRHCDVNGDKKITMTEWLECLGAKSEINSNKRPVNRSNGRRQGKNPFTTILKQR